MPYLIVRQRSIYSNDHSNCAFEHGTQDIRIDTDVSKCAVNAFVPEQIRKHLHITSLFQEHGGQTFGAKYVFAVHGVDETGKAVLARPEVPRAKLMELIAILVPALSAWKPARVQTTGPVSLPSLGTPCA
jgi:hypothetical protein